MKYNYLDPTTLKVGSIYQNKGSAYYLVSFISEVRDTGVWVEMKYRDSQHRDTYPGYEFHHLLAGHGGLISFSSTYWNERPREVIGYLPSLAGKQFVWLGSPMCSRCGERPPFTKKSKRGFCIGCYQLLEKTPQ